MYTTYVSDQEATDSRSFSVPARDRSYLKLYTTMPISKLAAFMEIEERVLKTHLLAFKHKMKNVVWTKGSGSSGLEGELQSSSEVCLCPSVRPVV